MLICQELKAAGAYLKDIEQFFSGSVDARYSSQFLSELLFRYYHEKERRTQLVEIDCNSVISGILRDIV